MDGDVKADNCARVIIRGILDGDGPLPDATPDDCGGWSDEVAALIVAHAEGGSQAARAAYNALSKLRPDLIGLVAAQAPARLPVTAQRTDSGNADRLVAEHGERLRFCHPWGTWLVWDGRRWARDEDGTLGRLAKRTVRGVYREAEAAVTDDEAKRWARWATSSLSQHRLRALVEGAQVELPVLPAVLDADPWVLNVKNGILDLRSGQLRAHDPRAYITKLAPVIYDAEASLPLWDRFLTEATGGDEALAAFVQRAVGYSLTGNVDEEKLFFVYGPTATGKSTFLDACGAVLGDYALVADFETFLYRRITGAPRPDIAGLAGARFIRSIEVAHGKRLAEGVVKILTGRDRIRARFLYGKDFEYDPTFKLWLAANEAPHIRASDSAIWRRILRVPFDSVVPEERRDPAVKTVLRDPDVAGPAILAWAVRGCLAWQRDGLGDCAAVTEATADLRASMDPLAEFLVGCCVLDVEAWTASGQLRAAYERFCRESGTTAVGGRRWTDRLKAHGCAPLLRRHEGRVARGWVGIGLLSGEVEEEV